MNKSMNAKSWISILLACLICFTVFTSCSKKDEESSADSDVATDTATDTSDSSDDIVGAITTDALNSMKIVYEQEHEKLLLESAEKLATAIKSKLDIDMEITSDFIREGSSTFCEKEYEILIGSTARDDDDEFSASLAADDRGYRQVGTKISICGGNPYEATVAVEEFIYYIINMNSCPEGVFYNSDCDRLVEGKYPVKSLKLNGVDYTEYSVVYSDDENSFNETVANRVSEVIGRLTGKALKVKSDDAAYADGYEILVGKTNRTDAALPSSEHGCMYGSDKLITLAGDTVSALSDAAELLIKSINDKATENADVSLSVTDTVSVQKDEKVSMMTFNLLTADMTTVRKAAVSSIIRQYLPDVFGVQEANPTWMGLLENQFSEYYANVGQGRDGGNSGEHSAIFYAKERFELIDSGTKWLSDTPDKVSQMTGAQYIRIFTYAELKDLNTNETLLVVNTHLDIASEEIRTAEFLILLEFLKSYEDIPVVLMGDMNFKYNSDTYNVVDGTCLVSTTEFVEKLNAQTWVDWIFVTENCFEVNTVRICNERIGGYEPSDHDPVYVELTFDIPLGGVENNWGDPKPVYPDEFLDVEEDGEGESYGEAVRLPDLLA